jgi:predicted RNase H-like nuclease (RuvC/YqgF family)
MRSKHRTDADAEINRLHAELAAVREENKTLRQAEEKFGLECQGLRDDLERIQREHNIELRLDRLGAAVKEIARLRTTIDKALEEASCHDGSMAEMVHILAAGRGEGI